MTTTSNLESTIYHLPDDLMSDRELPADEVIIRHYQSAYTSEKNKIMLSRNMINLLVSGTKTVVYPHETAVLHGGELVLLSTGNMLTSELISDDKGFASLLVYFSNDVLNRFLLKHDHLLQQLPGQASPKPFQIYRQDAFIRHFIQSLLLLVSNPTAFSAELRQLKLEELLLYLLQQDAAKLRALQIVSQDTGELQLKKVVETHIGQPVTVEELAFLCNMSSSTFKRKFERLYNTSPQKWLREQKLQLAADLLHSSSEIPSEVYHKVGYQNHSSFSAAFREHFGVTPSDYQARQQ
ncbi:MAG: helix-turn-helix transcriptional regulator [Niastella sp.]|nr:helix-turn-helix transcriptional regulator [Niastella sp.]